MWAPRGAVATVSLLQTGGQVPLGRAEMLAELTSTSANMYAARLPELALHCRSLKRPAICPTSGEARGEVNMLK